MKSFFNVSLLIGLAGVVSCNGFKLDSEKNCLNQESSCFKWDKTDPAFASATPTPGSQRTILPTITLVFSEELKNGEDKSAYVLSGAGAQGLSIAAVKKISSLTYEVSLNGSIVASAPINLDFSALKDYSNNFISGQKSISYAGNVAVGITGTASHNGLGVGGYTDLTVTFQHSYATDPENTWQISVTSGVVYCGAGTEVDKSATGVYLASGVSQTSQPINYINFGGAGPLGVGVSEAYKLIICVKNKNNANVQSLWSWQIIRDDSAPTISSATPVSDSYGTFQNFTVTCGDNAETIAYNSRSAGADPGAPDPPTFDANGGINTGTGVAYTTPVSVTNSSGNPTYTNFATRCIDIAGHLSPALITKNYVIDTTIPPVNVTLAGTYHPAVSNTAGGYASTTLQFTTDQVSPKQYKIIRSGTNCADGAAINLIGPTTLPATAFTLVSNTLLVSTAINFPTPDGTAHDIRICVEHPILAGVWGPAYLQITRDDVLPVFTTGLTSLTNPGDGSVTLGWNPATDLHSGIEGYDICQSTVASPGAGSCAAAFTATYQAPGSATGYTITGLNTGTTYYFMVRARDLAGNREANVVEKKSRLNLSVTVAGYSGALPNFSVTEGGATLSFTGNGTQTFSKIYLSGNSYSVSIANQPAGQVCSFIQNQYGSIINDMTLNVTCVSGYISGGSMTVNPAAPLHYRLYRGNTTILAGGGTGTVCTGTNMAACSNGTGTASRYNSPHGMTIVNGTIYIADRLNHRIRRYVISTNTTSTFAGEGTQASVDGTGLSTAQFDTPNSITTDGANLYVGELNTGRIRKIEIATQNVTTIAGGASVGGGTNCPGTVQASCLDGYGLQANFGQLNDLDYDNGYIYICDYSLARIRRLNLATGQVDTIAGSGSITSSDSGTGITASFQNIGGAALVNGALYVLDINAHKIRSVSLTSPYAVTTIAGTGVSGNIDGPTSIARFYSPDNVTTDGRNLFIAEFGGNRIRKIDLTKNLVTTIAGSGIANDTAGVGATASFNGPVGIVSDGSRLYAASFNTGRIFRIADQGLVGYWPLGVSTRDYSSDVTTTFNGTPQNGPTQTTGRFSETAGAYNFSGTNQYVSASPSNLPSGTAPETMCAWIKPTALPSPAAQPMVIMGHGGALINGMRSFGIHNNSGTQMLSFRGRGSDVEFPFTLSTTNWSHVCATFQHIAAGTQWASVFVNGRLIGRADTPVDWSTDVNSLTMGGPNLSGDIYFNGAITDVRVYNRILSEGEINELAQDATAVNVGASYNTGATGLLSHYGFSDGLPAAANLQPSGPLGGTLGGSASSLNGKDGDASGSAYFAGSANLSAAVAGLPSGNAPRTMCAFFAPQSYPPAVFSYAASYGDISTFSGFGIGVKDIGGGVYQIANTFSSGSDNLVTFKVPLNTWNHLCATYDGAVSKLYLNGALMGSQPAALTTVLTSFKIGSWLNNSQYMQGKIDDVRIYNNALSAQQVRQLATQVPAGLVLRLDMNGDATDVSGFGQTLVANTGNAVAGRQGVANTAYRFTSGQIARFAHSDSLMGQQDMTWSFWMKSPDMNNLLGELLSKYVPTPNSGWVIKYASNVNYAHGWTVGTAGNGAFSNSFKVPSSNVWNHYAYVRSGSGITVYINGLSYSDTVNGNGTAIIPNVNDMIVGLNGTGEVALQDTRIYNRALTAAEVRALTGYHVVQSTAGLSLHAQANTYSNLTDGTTITTNWIDSTIQTPYNAAGGALTGSPRLVSGASSLLGGKPAIEFDGIDTKYFDFGTTSLTYSGVTVCAAFTRKGSGYRGLVEKRGGSTANSWGMITNNTAGSMKFEVGDPPSANAIDTVADDVPTIYCMVSGPAGVIQTFVNGQTASTVTGAAISGSNAQPLLIGSRYTFSGAFYGQIGDVFLMTKDASAAERLIGECYLSAKYSIPLASSAVCP